MVLLIWFSEDILPSLDKFNSLASGRRDSNFLSKLFRLIIQNSRLVTCCEIALRWMPQNLSYEKSSFVQVMAWGCQAKSHYLSPCWPRSMFPYGITKPQYDIFSCDQAALWMVFSVRLSVRLSHLFDYVPIIVSSWNFQELSHWTRVRSMQKVKVRGQRSRSQRSRPKFSFPDCNSSLNSHMMMKWYI